MTPFSFLSLFLLSGVCTEGGAGCDPATLPQGVDRWLAWFHRNLPPRPRPLLDVDVDTWVQAVTIIQPITDQINFWGI
jgi:hypothetical protein